MKRLLEKYRRGIISTDELKQLSAGMDAASDSELAGLLEKEWMNQTYAYFCHARIKRNFKD